MRLPAGLCSRPRSPLLSEGKKEEEKEEKRKGRKGTKKLRRKKTLPK